MVYNFMELETQAFSVERKTVITSYFFLNLYTVLTVLEVERGLGGGIKVTVDHQ